MPVQAAWPWQIQLYPLLHSDAAACQNLGTLLSPRHRWKHKGGQGLRHTQLQPHFASLQSLTWRSSGLKCIKAGLAEIRLKFASMSPVGYCSKIVRACTCKGFRSLNKVLRSKSYGAAHCSQHLVGTGYPLHKRTQTTCTSLHDLPLGCGPVFSQKKRVLFPYSTKPSVSPKASLAGTSGLLLRRS